MNTSQHTELDRVKLKIKALMQKTIANGCSEAEADAAMHAVGRLLTQYKLTANELDVRTAAFKTLEISIDGNRHKVGNCVTAIADYVDAQCWYQNRGPKTSYSFFGHEQDVMVAEYYFKLCKATIDSELYRRDPEYIAAPNKRAASNAFQHGLTDRLNARLREMKKAEAAELQAREAELQRAQQAAGGSGAVGSALVVLKKQLVKEEFARSGPKLRHVRTTRSIRDWSAYGAGSAAADRVNLNRPIGAPAKAGARGLLK
jgi:Protein of unknown function (DUF2786)